jgi:tetratricopeptide (TPR) repeat protein
MPSNQRRVATIADAWRVYLVRGTRAARNGDAAGARAAFERALGVAPREPAVLRALGLHLARTGQDLDRAGELLALALEQRPSSHATAAALARLVGLQLGRLDEARVLLDAVEQRSGSACILWLVRGELALANEDPEAAEKAFEAALRYHRSSAAHGGLARALNARGIRLSEGGHAEAAARAFARAARLDPGWSAPQVNLGVMYARSGDLSAAVAAYQDALRRDPHNPAAFFNLGMAQYELGELMPAVQSVERVLALCPDYPEARTNLANALVDLGDYDRAVALLLQEIERDGDAPQVWSSLGLAYVCAGNVDRGEECLRRALDLDRNHFNAYFNLAVLYATQGRKGEAEQVFAKALQLDPARASDALRAGAGERSAASRLSLEDWH